MANEQAVFKKATADLLYYGLPINRETVMLHCPFVSTACPHRSMALHTSFDPVRQGVAPTSIVNQLKDYFIKEIKKYYNNPLLKASSLSSTEIPDRDTIPIPKPNEEEYKETSSKGWKQNQFGTWYKSEQAKFICGNTTIEKRVGSPFIRDDIFGYWFQPSGYVNYGEVCL